MARFLAMLEFASGIVLFLFAILFTLAGLSLVFR